jgi:hypothetical protein
MNRSLFGLAQAAVCGLVMGLTLFACVRLWQPGSVHAAPGIAAVVRAREFQVVDKNGRMRASLGLGRLGNCSGLWLYGAVGKARAGLAVLADGSPGLTLWDATGKPRADLGTGLTLYDAAGEPRATLSVLTKDNSPYLALIDTTGRPRVGLDMLADGTPGLALWDAAGKSRVVLTTLADGHPSLELCDATGKDRATLGVLADGGLILSMRDAVENPRIALEVSPDGTPGVLLWNANGKVLSSLP